MTSFSNKNTIKSLSIFLNLFYLNHNKDFSFKIEILTIFIEKNCSMNKPLTSLLKMAKISSGAMASKVSMKLKMNSLLRRLKLEVCSISQRRFKLKNQEMEKEESKLSYHSILTLMKRESHAVLLLTEDGCHMI